MARVPVAFGTDQPLGVRRTLPRNVVLPRPDEPVVGPIPLSGEPYEPPRGPQMGMISTIRSSVYPTPESIARRWTDPLVSRPTTFEDLHMERVPEKVHTGDWVEDEYRWRTEGEIERQVTADRDTTRDWLITVGWPPEYNGHPGPGKFNAENPPTDAEVDWWSRHFVDREGQVLVPGHYKTEGTGSILDDLGWEHQEVLADVNWADRNAEERLVGTPRDVADWGMLTSAPDVEEISHRRALERSRMGEWNVTPTGGRFPGLTSHEEYGFLPREGFGVFTVEDPVRRETGRAAYDQRASGEHFRTIEANRNPIPQSMAGAIPREVWVEDVERYADEPGMGVLEQRGLPGAVLPNIPRPGLEGFYEYGGWGGSRDVTHPSERSRWGGTGFRSSDVGKIDRAMLAGTLANERKRREGRYSERAASAEVRDQTRRAGRTAEREAGAAVRRERERRAADAAAKAAAIEAALAFLEAGEREVWSEEDERGYRSWTGRADIHGYGQPPRNAAEAAANPFWAFSPEHAAEYPDKPAPGMFPTVAPIAGNIGDYFWQDRELGFLTDPASLPGRH